MLTGTTKDASELGPAAIQGKPNELDRSARSGGASQSQPSRLAKALQIEWIGQTVASLCWIGSVFSYGITSTGDWLQLFAASAWLTANIAAVMAVEAD
ncbi:MAG: hypothetical protein AAGA92_10975 [Planctomycetota bacterium]